MALIVDASVAIKWFIDHPVYDCFYLALAEMEKAELVSVLAAGSAIPPGAFLFAA
jgi:predicted nucleic acid-binding protein